MKMLMIRHAARSLHDLGDTPLSSQGRLQAEHLRQLIDEGQIPAPTELISSPKKRAKETLAELAMALELPVTIENRLDERHQNESAREFEDRVRSFLEEITSDEAAENREKCIAICSHLDWLELAIVLLPSTLSENEIADSWSNAEYRIFRYVDGLWKLTARGTA